MQVKAAHPSNKSTLITGICVWSAMTTLGWNDLSRARAQGVPCSYSVQVLPNVDCGSFGGPGGPTAINNHGHVIGIFVGCGTPVTESFLWTGGDELTIIQRPFGVLSFSATDINDEGLITGSGQTSGAGQRGFIYNSKTGEWTQLPPPNPAGQGWSSAESINNKGQVCGYRSVNDGGDPINPWMAYIWTPGAGFTDLGLIDGESTACTSIADNGAAVGTMFVDGIFRGFLWHQGELEDLGTIAEMDTIPLAINDQLQIVGKSKVPGSNPFGWNHPFHWSKGAMVDLGLFRGYSAGVAQDIDVTGVVIGLCRQGSDDRPFIWNGGTIVDLNSLLSPKSNILVEAPSALNASGQIIATASDQQRSPITVLLTPETLQSDLVPNCAVDVDDLLLLINEWGDTNSVADINNDNVVGIDDLLLLLEDWTIL